MKIPEQLLTAQELVDQACKLASAGFGTLISGGASRSDEINAFAKVIGSLNQAQDGFKQVTDCLSRNDRTAVA